jgi:hypothetical protein
LQRNAPDIRISLSENFGAEEYEEARKLFDKFGTVETTTYFRAGADPLTLFAIMTVSFALANFASGFFTRMCEDVYDWFKTGLASLVTRERKPMEKATTLEYQFPYDGINVHARVETRDSLLVKDALTNSRQIIDLLEQAKSSAKLPSPVSQIHITYDNAAKRWKFTDALGLSVSEFVKYRFNESSESWEKIQ